MDLSVMFFASLATGSTAAHYRLLLDAARRADAEGFAGVWTPERHFDEFGGVFPNPALTSAALAVATERIQLRAGSVISPLHDALLVAEDWSVVDNLSGGRAAVSFGSGWNPDDFVLNAKAYRDRRELMWEQIGVVQHLWRGGTVRRANGAGVGVDVGLLPRPVQPELPLWITTGGTADTFVRAGAAGANLLTHLITQDLDPLAAHVVRYRAARADAGHDPDTGCVTVMAHTFVGSGDDEVRAVAGPPLRAYLRSALLLDMKAAGARDEDGYDDDLLDELLEVRLERYLGDGGVALLGDSDRCARVLGDLADVGIDDVACLLDFGIAADQVLQGLDRLCEVRRRSATSAKRTSATRPSTGRNHR